MAGGNRNKEGKKKLKEGQIERKKKKERQEERSEGRKTGEGKMNERKGGWEGKAMTKEIKDN